jgi:hypothetical protein
LEVIEMANEDKGTLEVLISAEDEALMAKLLGQYPANELRMLRVDKRIGPVVLRNPTPQEHALGEKDLFVAVCVHPADPAALIERFPGLTSHGAVKRALAYLAGSSSEA